MNIYYVYIYVDPRYPTNTINGIEFPGQPFYVGKGKGHRDKTHLAESRTRTHNTLKHDKIQRIFEEGMQPIILRVLQNATEETALANERMWIATIGTKWNISNVPRGPLTNMTSGGDRGTPCDVLKARYAHHGAANGMYGKTHSDEAKAKISAYRQTFVHSNETKRKMSEVRNSKEWIDARSIQWIVTLPDGSEVLTNRLKLTCEELGVNYNSLYNAYKRGTKMASGFNLRPSVIEDVADSACLPA